MDYRQFIQKPFLKNSVSIFRRRQKNNIDAHIHTEASPDAFLTIDDIIEQANQNGLSHVAITDHNTCIGIDNYMRALGLADDEIYFVKNGVKVICGAEVTCSYRHKNNYAQKLHILCYGFNRDPNNQFMQLLDAKYRDYQDTFFTIPETLANFSDLYTPLYDKKEFKEYIFLKRLNTHQNTHNSFSNDDVADYYAFKGISRQKVLSDISNMSHLFKNRDIMHLDVTTVIDAVHNCGGKCIVAHPIKSYKKFMQKYKCDLAGQWQYTKSMTDKLLALGVDGVELISVTKKTSEIKKLFNQYYKNVGFTSYGTDKHDNAEGSPALGTMAGYNPLCNFKEVIEGMHKQPISSTQFSMKKKNLTYSNSKEM